MPRGKQGSKTGRDERNRLFQATLRERKKMRRQRRRERGVFTIKEQGEVTREAFATGGLIPGPGLVELPTGSVVNASHAAVYAKMAFDAKVHGFSVIDSSTGERVDPATLKSPTFKAAKGGPEALTGTFRFTGPGGTSDPVPYDAPAEVVVAAYESVLEPDELDAEAIAELGNTPHAHAWGELEAEAKRRKRGIRRIAEAHGWTFIGQTKADEKIPTNYTREA